jgi:hypothetical protein
MPHTGKRLVYQIPPTIQLVEPVREIADKCMEGMEKNKQKRDAENKASLLPIVKIQ